MCRSRHGWACPPIMFANGLGALGGRTILRHSLLRLQLASRQTFALQARPWLSDAVARVLLKRLGGGYAFVHRRLLDSFAETSPFAKGTPPVSQQSPDMSLQAPSEAGEPSAQITVLGSLTPHSAHGPPRARFALGPWWRCSPDMPRPHALVSAPAHSRSLFPRPKAPGGAFFLLG